MLVVDCCMGSGGEMGQGTLCKEDMDLGEVREVWGGLSTCSSSAACLLPECWPQHGTGWRSDLGGWGGATILPPTLLN